MKKILSLIAALAVVITLTGCGGDKQNPTTPTEPTKPSLAEGETGTVTIDINPGFEFKVDAAGVVVEVKACNPDAESLLDINVLVGKDIKDVAKIIAEKATEEGYISKDENQDILVGVDDKFKGSELEKGISDAVVDQLQASDVTAKVNTMIVNATDELIKKAEEAGVSVGKLQLIGDNLDQANATITDIMKNVAVDTTNTLIDVAYNASEAMSKELEKYKVLVEQELNYEAQKEKLEEAYDKGQIARDEFKAQVKEIEAKLKELEKASDDLEDRLEENGFDLDDTLDYLEDQIENAFNKENLDQTAAKIKEELAKVEAEAARLKAEFKRGLIDKKQYEDQEERLDALEDKLDDQFKYYKKFGEENKAKYEEYVAKLEEKYQANIDYLDGKIKEIDLEKIEDQIEEALNKEVFDKIKDGVDLSKYQDLQAKAKEQYEKGLISKKEFEKRLDAAEDYFDELEDILDNDEGIDEEELQEFLEENTSPEAKQAVAALIKASEDFKNGLISAEQYAAERMKFDQLEDAFEEYGDSFEKFGKDIVAGFDEFNKGFEDLFNKTSQKVEEALKDLNEAGQELGKDIKKLIKEQAEINKEKAELLADKLAKKITDEEYQEELKELEEELAELAKDIKELKEAK